MNPWERITTEELAKRLKSGWQWRPQKKTPRLQLLDPQGALWDFKMAHGTWIRRATS